MAVTTKDRILEELTRGGRTTKQLMSKLGGTYAAVHTSLKRMKDRGLVVEVNEVNGVKLPAGPTGFLISFLTSLDNSQTYADAQKQAAAKLPRKQRTVAILVRDFSGSTRFIQDEIAASVNATLGDLTAQAFRNG